MLFSYASIHEMMLCQWLYTSDKVVLLLFMPASYAKSISRLSNSMVIFSVLAAESEVEAIYKLTWIFEHTGSPMQCAIWHSSSNLEVIRNLWKWYEPMISHHFGAGIVIIYMDLKSFAMIKASLLLLARHAWQNPETPDSPVLLALKLCGLYIVKITPFSLLFDLRHKRTKKIISLDTLRL